jgi:hypothetical protein
MAEKLNPKQIVSFEELLISQILQEKGSSSDTLANERGQSFAKSFAYFPYPSFSRSSLGMNFNDAEFMQYRSPVGKGPSLKTWPRWESPCLLLTSVLLAKKLRSSFSTIFPDSRGLVKLGHPVPESYLSRELKSGSPETIST